MNSLFANIYLALRNLIADLQDGDGNKYFRFVDQDYGQLEWHTGDNRAPVSWPCVLIDINRASFSNHSQNTQEGIITVVLRLGFPPYSGTSNLTDPDYANRALQYYDLEQVLHQALHGYTPELLVDEEDALLDITGHMMRTGTSTEERADHIRVRILTYTLPIQDYTTKPTTTFTPAAPSFTYTIHT